MEEFDRDGLVPHLEVRFHEWQDLKKYIEDHFRTDEERDWVFRGHSNADYELQTALDRLPVRHRPLIAEQYLLYQFQKAAHHYIESAGLPQTTLEWLSLMQHYGTPTRLLDFTRSSYVACFFALGSKVKTQWRAIWCINAKWLRKKALDIIQRSVAGYESLQDSDLMDASFNADHFSKLFLGHSVPMVLALEPPRSNERLLVQQGLFLCPGAVDKTFEANLSSYKDDAIEMRKNVIKLMIKNEDKERLEGLRQLHFMNVTNASLFQGLGGFAQSLGHKLEVEYQMDQLERMLLQPSLLG